MTVHEENGVYRSVMRDRRTQRRKQLGVGLAGLLALAGAGAFVVQAQVIDLSERTAAQEPRVIAPPPSPSPSPSPSEPSPSEPSPAAASNSRSASPTPALVTRSGARQETSPTPLPSPTPAGPTPAAVVSALSPKMAAAETRQVTRRNETTGEGTIRVTSAGFDLGGRPELAIAGDRGWAVGRARCTKSIRSGPDHQVRVVPSTLVCWRTSPNRSVVTVAVADQGRPSSGTSVTVLDREWARIGS
jgi:hypothetical protein